MTEKIDGLQTRHKIKGPILDALMQFVIPDILLEGAENLQQIRELSSKNTPARPIFFFPNHLSNADAPAIMEALSRNGFEDIADRLVFLLGIKLKKNPIIRPVTNSYSIITVWPPSLEPKNEKEKKERMLTHRRSLLATRESLKHGLHLVVFPEAGRSRTGSLIKGQPAVMHYIPDNALIVPVGIRGTERILKPGTLIPMPWNHVTVTFGSSIEVQTIMDKKLKLDQRRENAMAHIMAAIADILPPQYRGAPL